MNDIKRRNYNFNLENKKITKIRNKQLDKCCHFNVIRNSWIVNHQRAWGLGN